jgi:hypothetical protein
MGTIINLKSYKAQKRDQRGFSRWKKRFGETCGRQTQLSDLSGKMIYYLATPGEESTVAFFELIMGVLTLGPADQFTDIQRDEQIRVVDIHLFMADQVRLEMLCRLGWLCGFSCKHEKLYDMITNFESMRQESNTPPPDVSSSHPGFGDYINLSDREKDGFVRRLLPQSLEAFSATLNL